MAAPKGPSKQQRPPSNEAPFGDGRPFVNHQPLMGGEIFVIPGPVNANTDVTINHFLKKIPRGYKIFDTGQTATVPKRGTVAWSFTTATFQFTVAIPGGTSVVGLLL